MSSVTNKNAFILDLLKWNISWNLALFDYHLATEPARLNRVSPNEMATNDNGDSPPHTAFFLN